MAHEHNGSDIELLIAEFEKSGLRELHARHGDSEIYLSKDRDAPGLDDINVGQTPVGRIDPGPSARKQVQVKSAVAQPVSDSGWPDEWPDNAQIVRAPYLGTFYRSPKPGAAPYVDVDQSVTEDTELCLVEVMKLFTSIQAGCRGKIYAILAKDGEMVAADQPLFVVVPE